MLFRGLCPRKRVNFWGERSTVPDVFLTEWTYGTPPRGVCPLFGWASSIYCPSITSNCQALTYEGEGTCPLKAYLLRSEIRSDKALQETPTEWQYGHEIFVVVFS